MKDCESRTFKHDVFNCWRGVENTIVAGKEEQIGKQLGECDTGVAYAETCEEGFMATVSFVRRREQEGKRFNLGQFIGWSLFLPQIDPMVGDMVSYEESKVRYNGKEICFDKGKICGSFRSCVNRFITLDAPMTRDPDKSNGKGDGR